MIYCVIPPALADELYDKLTDYYANDPGVEVIIDRRKCERRERGSTGGGKRKIRDRRRRRPGMFPAPRALELTERVVVHVDGGARGNPGPAGVGAVVTDERRHGARPRERLHRCGDQQRRPSTARCCSASSVHGSSEPARWRSSTTPS